MSQLALLSLVAASQGFMLMLVFLRLEQGNKLANRILSCFIGVQTIRLLTYYLLYQEAFVDHAWVYLAMNLNLAAGPLIFLYVQCLTTPNFRLRGWMALHFLPMMLYFVGASIWVNLHGWEVGRLRSWLWESQLEMAYSDGDEFYAVTILIGLIYGGLACRLLWRHSHRIRHQFSSLEAINLRWLWLVLGIYVGGTIVGAARDLLMLFIDFNLGPRMLVALLASAAQIYYIAYKGLRQQTIYQVEENVLEAQAVHSEEQAKVPEQLELSPAMPEEKPQTKYRKSGLSAERSLELWQTLGELMKDQRPYLDSTLSLTQLASLISVSNDYLTQAINTHGEKNFYDFINDYRVEAARDLLADAQGKRSLLDIALDSGFSSQSAFSTRFKGVVGMTPSQYRKSLKMS